MFLQLKSGLFRGSIIVSLFLAATSVGASAQTEEAKRNMPAPFSVRIFSEASLSREIRDVVKEIRPIVMKKEEHEGGKIAISYGTALLLSDSTAITAYHNLRNAVGALVLPVSGSDTSVVYDVKPYNDKADVAMLQMEGGSRGVHRELCLTPEYAVGDTVYNIGFVSDSVSNNLTITGGIILYTWDDEGLYPKMVTSAEGVKGTSGGVIVHQSGCIIGIITHVQFASRGAGYYTFQHYRNN